MLLGLLILATARLFVAYEILHPLLMFGFLVLTAVCLTVVWWIFRTGYRLKN